ncbi:unnamed protein product [Parascedosporium putredinis]|uniref:Uncharacterized protein n=1 Tax=Parascedosporium putredinis TaxID=1442378 RepID=A0A9P1GWS3_9PEZI|nr:unnamed protein product [Parascedosporium putredinis]CAI7989023.1 unnamed protein product [Parascedosporium putredinis]
MEVQVGRLEEVSSEEVHRHPLLYSHHFYSGPLRGIFSTLQRRHLLRDVQTLVLDGLSVTADLCHELLNDPKFNVRILSLRGAKNLNERSLRKALKYACRPSRPANSPRLRGLYIFTSKPTESQIGEEVGASGDLWYVRKGRVIDQELSSEWAETLIDCQGVISFDAPLCTAPCHMNSPRMVASLPNRVRSGPLPRLHALDESQASEKSFNGAVLSAVSTCIGRTQKTCTGCGGGYCIVHHEGSSPTLCDWCSQRRRQMVTAQNAPPRAIPQHPQQMPGCKTKSKQAWLTWMRNQNSIGERRARERTFPRDGLRCLAARS